MKKTRVEEKETKISIVKSVSSCPNIGRQLEDEGKRRKKKEDTERKKGYPCVNQRRDERMKTCLALA